MAEEEDDITSPEAEETPPERPRGPRWRHVLAILGIVLGAIVAMVVLFFIVLQTNWGAARFGNFLFGLFNPYDDTKTEYAEITGNFVTWVELRDVNMIRSDSLRMAHFDTVRIRYNPLELFTGKIRVTEFYLANPELTARQQPDGSWDLLKPFLPDTTQIDTLEQERWFDFLADKIRITDLDLYARYYVPGRDSVLRIQDLNLDATDFLVDEMESIRVDSLWGRFAPPQSEQWVNVRLAGILDHGRLDLKALRLLSARSRIQAAGQLNLPSRDKDYVDRIRFTLRARPVHFDDIRPFLPGIALQDSAVVNLQLTGTSRLMNVDLDAGVARNGRLELAGQVTPMTGPVRYDLTGSITRLDPAVLTGGTPGVSLVNARLNVDLRGVRPETIAGTATLNLFDTNFGDYTIDPTALSATFRQGRGDVTLRGGLRGMTLRASGVTRPFDDVPTYQFTGALANLDVGRFSTDPAQSSDIDASFRIQGRGIDMKSANATADFQIARSRINRTRIESAHLTLTLEDGDLDVGTRVLFPEGSVFASGSVAFGDTLSYEVRRGRFEKVDLAALLGDDVSSSLNGAFTLSGRGTDPEHMTARGNFEVFGSHYGDFRIANVNLGARMRSGRVDMNARADLEEAGSADFVAVAYPFADVASLDVRRGEFRNVDVGKWTGDPTQQSDLNGTLVFSIRDFNPNRMRFRGRLDLDPSQVNDQQIQSASVIGAAQRGAMNFSANVILPEGRFSARGDARPFDRVPTYTLTDGLFEGLNLGAFTGNPEMRSNLNGTFAVSGRGLNPQTMMLDGRIYVRQSRINDQVINTASLTGQMSRGTLDFNLAVTAPEGRTRLNGIADFLADVPTYTVREGTFSGLNVGALAGNPSLESRLNGSLALSGRGFDPETMTIDGRIRLTSSRMNQQQIDSALVALNLSGGLARFSLNLNVPGGATQLAGNARPFLEVPTYEVTQGTFSGLNLGAFTGSSGLQTNLAGNVTLQGSGFDPQTMQLAANLNLGAGTFNHAAITGGSMTALVQNGQTTVDANVALRDGNIQFAANGNFFDEQPVYSITGNLVNVNLGDMAARDSLDSRLTARFDVRGTGFDPHTMTLVGTVRSDSTSYQNADVSRLDADFRLENGYLQVDAFALEANFADIVGRGGIALFDSTRASDFRFDAAIRTLEPIRPLLPVETFALQDADITGHVFGTAGELAFEVDGTIGTLVYGNYRLAGFNGSLAGNMGPDRQLDVAEVHASTDYLYVPGLPAQRANVDISYRDNQAVFRANLEMTRQRNALIVGRADLREPNQIIELDTLNLRMEGDQWQLLQPATISISDVYRVSGLLLYSADQQLAIDGVIDPNGQQNLVFTAENFRMGAVSDLLGYEGLDGRISGGLDLTGPASAPNLTGTLTANVVSNDQPVGDLRLDVRYDSLRLNLDALLTHQDGSNMHMTGYVPMNLALSPSDSAAVGEGVAVQTEDVALRSGINLRVVADSFAIGWVAPFFDKRQLEDIGGSLSGEFLITGTFGNPVLDGNIRVNGGYLRLPNFGVTYRDIALDATLQQSQVNVTRLVMRSGDGTASATGTITLQQLTLGNFDFDATLDRFWAIDSDQYRASASGNLELQGTTRAPVVTGSIALDRTDIFLDELAEVSDLERVELSDADIRMLQERFGYVVDPIDTTTSDFYDSMDLRLDVNMARDMWLRQSGNPELAIQFSGNLDVRKQPHGEEEIYGTITVVPQRSYIDQFGRRFDIRSGTITFNGSATDFLMNVEAEYRIRQRQGTETEATIILALNGRMDNLRTTLRSEPQMDQSDIISYIATGQPADPSLLLGGELLLSQGRGIAISQLSGIVEGAAREGLGLDVVQVQQDPFGDLQLVAGKYLSSKLYVGVTQPMSMGGLRTEPSIRTNQSTSFTAEYQFIDWLLMRLSAQRGSLQGNLLWEFSY